VTLPHKEAALGLADKADELAKAVGAANTLWFDGDVLCASNTDVYGFITHLNSSAPNWNADALPCVVLGAGGAARAVLKALTDSGISEVRLANRTPARAEALAEHFDAPITVIDWERRGEALAGCGLLVNTTSLGMGGAPPLDINLEAMAKSAVVADIVYTPLETWLLRQARERGFCAVDGLGMLLHQAVPGFEKWFGKRPDVDDGLRDQLRADIEAQSC